MAHVRKLATIRTCAVAALVAATLAAPAIALAGTSHTSVWETKSVICGIESPAINAAGVLCQASGIPRPPHSSRNAGDPGVVLTARGAPRLILMSQDSYPQNATIRSLAAGTTWKARGVTCVIGRRNVTCKNQSGDGFTIGNGAYKHF